MEYINISDAYEHNLKHLDLKIPLNAFTCITGCSGCGKSSLVFDTIYAESQRGFLEGMTGNIYGQKLMNKPKVGAVENLRPALNISQNYYNVNPRSTIGTTTEISYYLRSLFALVSSINGVRISEGDFSANNPKAFCAACAGLGVTNDVSVDLLVPNKDKRLCDGAILLFKGAPESKEMRILEGLCGHYGIDITKRYSDLSEREVYALMLSDDKVKYKIAYKEGRRRKQHFVFLQGAMSIIKEKLSHTEGLSSTPTTNMSPGTRIASMRQRVRTAAAMSSFAAKIPHGRGSLARNGLSRVAKSALLPNVHGSLSTLYVRPRASSRVQKRRSRR